MKRGADTMDRHPYLRVKKLHPSAVIPVRATEDSIGYDLCALESIRLPIGEVVAVRTGISVEFCHKSTEFAFYIKIEERSSLAMKNLTVKGGVIDAGYRGEIKVLLRNDGSEYSFDIRAGDKIAQAIIQVAITCPVVEFHGEFEKTIRGEQGFGSTDSLKTNEEMVCNDSLNLEAGAPVYL